MEVLQRTLTIEDILAYQSVDGIVVPAIDISPADDELAAVITQGYAERDHAAMAFMMGMDRGQLHLIELDSGAVRRVPAPAGHGLASPLYSPDGQYIAVAVGSAEGIGVGVVDRQSLSVTFYMDRQLLVDPLRQPPFQWLNGDTLMCQLLPPGQLSSNLEASCHVRANASQAWARAMGNRLSTASALQIENNAVDGADPVLLGVGDERLTLLAAQDHQLSALEAFIRRPAASTTAEAALSDYYAAERVLWQGRGRVVHSWRGNQGAELRITEGVGPARCLLRFNRHLHDVGTGEVIDLTYSLADGRPGLVRCILPPDYIPGQRRPGVMFVYPRIERSMDSASHRWVQGPDLVYNAHLFAAQGYVVMEPNLPFDEALDGELIDALAKAVVPALDTVEGAGLIDRSRVQLFGQSAGGWAVMALLATTDEFRSGIAMAGVSDVASFDTQPDVRFRYKPIQANPHSIRIGGRMLGIAEKPWQAPQRYLHNSPLYRVQAIQAPLLLMHGDLDYVPISQSEAMFMAMQDEGKPAQFIRYWGEDHVYCSAANIRDAFNRIVHWLGRHAAQQAS